MIKSIARLAATAAICAAVGVNPAAADGNRASVLQISPPGGENGNVLILDQSKAANSTLGGMLVTGTLLPSGQVPNTVDVPAFQAGEGNWASVVLTGDGATARLLQATNGDTTTASQGGNRAEIIASSAAVASLTQVGLANAASLTLAPHATALVSQFGNGNLVPDLNIDAGGEAVVVQTGNGNNTGAITVPAGVTLNYSQTGNGLGPVGTSGVQVLYSAAPVAITITQHGR